MSAVVKKGSKSRIVVIAAAVLFMVMIMLGGGNRIVEGFFANLAGTVPVGEYMPLADSTGPSAVAFRAQLKSEGIIPEESELSVHTFTEASYVYKWERGADRREYSVRKNNANGWDVHRQ